MPKKARKLQEIDVFQPFAKYYTGKSEPRISFYIQTFPRSFKFVGTKTEQEQMIGNAVPVKLAEYVARSIVKYLEQPHRARNLEIDFENFLSFSQILY